MKYTLESQINPINKNRKCFLSKSHLDCSIIWAYKVEFFRIILAHERHTY
jgi:hypothetical protein